MNDKFVHVSVSDLKDPSDSESSAANVDIVTYIKNNYDSDMKYIKKCGIQSQTGHYISVDGINFEIGKTERLELNDVKITSLYFLQDEPWGSSIDAILE